MANEVIGRDGHRVNMHFPAHLYAEMKDWVHVNNSNITELCRTAVQYYLQVKQLTRKREELLKTCKALSEKNTHSLKEWSER